VALPRPPASPGQRPAVRESHTRRWTVCRRPVAVRVLTTYTVGVAATLAASTDLPAILEQLKLEKMAPSGS
jgi:hypothetical protein